ncbi:hypothetical protein Tco_0972455, partial [Tanacetum coccineum]
MLSEAQGVSLRITFNVRVCDENRLGHGTAHKPVIMGVSHDFRGFEGHITKGVELHVADFHTGNHREDDFSPLETIRRFSAIIRSKSLSSLKGRPLSRRGGYVIRVYETKLGGIKDDGALALRYLAMDSSNALRYSTFRCYPDLEVLQIAVMSSASSAVTYTTIYTDFEPSRPVSPPSLDYIPDSEEPHTPPIPQDEDEREPMFIQPHDPDYVPEPIYPEYIPLEDEHEFLVEEQPLPPVDSPTAESPGYVTESDLEEDPKEYKDDEIEDGPVDYPMDGGDDGDDDDGDSSGDDADDEDEDEEDEEEEEEEHLALADSAIVVPNVELVSPPKGTKPVIPPPSTDITTTGARITVRLQASISLPPEAEVERLLAMHTLPPSSPISLSPPSAGEPLARIASTQALVDAVTVALPSPPLPLLPPSLYIPPPVDCRDDIPKSEQPPHKRSCLFALGSSYEVGRVLLLELPEVEGDTWVDPAEAVPKIAPTTVGEVNTRVIELAELHEHDTQDLYALLEDVQDRLSQVAYYELQTHREQVYAYESQLHAHQTQLQLQGTLIQIQHQIVKTLCVMRDIRREIGDMQVELLTLREKQRRARQPGPDVRVPDHQDASRDADSHIYSHGDNRRNVQTAHLCFYADFMKCQPLNFKGTEGVVKFATCTLLGAALTWWNGQIRTLGPEEYSMTWEVKGNDVPTYTEHFQEVILICTKFVTNETEKVDKYISGLPNNIYGNMKSSRAKTLDETIELANDLMDQKLCTYAERQTENKRKADDSSRNNHGHQQQPFKRQNVAKVYNMRAGEKKPYGGSFPKDNRAVPKGNGCFECGAP